MREVFYRGAIYIIVFLLFFKLVGVPLFCVFSILVVVIVLLLRRKRVSRVVEIIIVFLHVGYLWCLWFEEVVVGGI